MTYKSLRYDDVEKTRISAVNEDGSIVLIEAATSGELWRLANGGVLGKVQAYKPPPEPSAKQKLEAERAAMRCSTAQFELTLLRAGSLARFRENMTPEAAIIVSRASHVGRKGEVLTSLQKIMKPTEIDDFFRTAMTTPIE